MKDIYLPNLQRIIYTNYTLYQQEPTFEFNFQNGINAVVGANGIGKTTFVNGIIYCLVGHKKKKNRNARNSKKKEYEYMDEDYFSSRMDLGVEETVNNASLVALDFYLGDAKFQITRNLLENRINKLMVNDNEIDEVTEQKYEELVEKYSKITEFDDFELLIREFLFFDERRNNVAWEVDSQDNILRILLLDEEYHLKINELEEKITKADTRGRHKSEDKRMAEASYKELIDEKNKMVVQVQNKLDIKDNLGQIDREKLVLQKNSIISDISSEIENLSTEKEKLQEIEGNISLLEGNIVNLSVVYDDIVTEIKRTETVLYKSIYSNLPDYYYTIEKNLLTEGKCLMCNTKSNINQQKASKIKQRGRCFVCGSILTENLNVDNKLVDTLNDLYKRKEEMLNKLDNLNAELKREKSKLEKKQEKIRSLEKRKEDLEKNKIILESELSKRNFDNKPSDVYTEILRNKEDYIEELEKSIRDAYAERDAYKQELNDYANKFENVVGKLNQQLSVFFNKYASTFIGLDCQLSVMKKVINRIPHIYYVPKINGQVRKDIWSVSESQRFFIDQAFRMAIIDYLKNEIEGFCSFFITETPEGSLDIAYETQVAMMFKIFSESNNKIIFTSNLNSSNFLKELYKGIQKSERRSRTLDLLKKGRVTMVQKNKMDQLESIISEILEV